MFGTVRAKGAAGRVLAAASGGIIGCVVVATAVASPAGAACHSFTVSASPATAGEGSTVTVTVTRDAGVEPSSIEVSTVDETATGGSDYEALATTVTFDTGTQQTLSIAVLDDTEVESSETFRVRLANPAGCSVQPSFLIGPDAVVTISDDDEAPPTTTAPDTTPPDEPAADEGDTGQSTPTTQPPAPSGGVDAGQGGTTTDSNPTGAVLGFVLLGAGLIVAVGSGAIAVRNRPTRP